MSNDDTDEECCINGHNVSGAVVGDDRRRRRAMSTNGSDSELNLLDTLRWLTKDWKAKQNRTCWECGDLLEKELDNWLARQTGIEIPDIGRLTQLNDTVKDYISVTSHECDLPTDCPRVLLKEKMKSLVV